MKKQISLKTSTLIFLFCVVSLFTNAQSHFIQKQFTLGGTGDDSPGNNILEVNGGFVVCGSTNSHNGTFSVPAGHDMDAYIVKYNSNGNVIWKHTYGGTNVDGFYHVTKTSDGGLIAIGYTSSNDGDVNGNHGGVEDVWVVKMNAAGNLQWQKCFGGSGDDFGYSILLTPGGYAFNAATTSSDGNINSNHGGFDVWVVKISITGTILQQNTYGGSDDESTQIFFRNTDGSFIICGDTRSNDGIFTGNHGAADMFAMKVNAAGNIIWKHLIGGSGDDNMNGATKTNDGNIVMGSLTNSTDGDETDNHGSNDSWLVKINAQNGNFIWKKSYGDALDQGAYGGVSATADGGVLAVGVTGNFSIGFNTDDVLIYKVDHNGNTVWASHFGGSDEDDGLSCLEANNGKIYVLAYSASSDGDVQNNHGGFDTWILKLDECGNHMAEKSSRNITANGNTLKSYPNPVSNSATIDFSLSQTQNVSLQIFDITGKLVTTLTNMEFSEGEHQIEWNAADVKAGIYFVHMQSEMFSNIEKLIVTK